MGIAYSILRGSKKTENLANSIFGYGLFGTFIILPAISTKTITFFACETFDDNYGRFMVADYSISCDSEKYQYFFYYALLCILIYPIGVPLFYITILYKNRRNLNPGQDEFQELTSCTDEEALEWALTERMVIEQKNPSVLRLSFLYSEYEPKYYW